MRNLQSSKRQNGLVLVIALIVLVAMSLAGVALVRSVDTSNVIAGNLGFKIGTLPDADIVTDIAAKALYTGGDYALEPRKPKENKPYFPSMQTLNSHGIPTDLEDKKIYDEKYPGVALYNETTGNTRRYIIERMCNDDGIATIVNCSPNGSPRSGAGTQRNEELFEFTPLFRITVRVDGPRNTTTFTQTIVRMS